MAAAGPVLSPLELTRRRRAWAGWVRLGRLERAGLAVLALTTAVAVLAPLLAPYSPTTAVHAESFAPPGTHGLLVGSDELSRDLFSRVLYGIRASWLSALAVIASGVLIGGLIGTVAGIAGGWIDTALMRVTDLFLALPAAVLAIAVIAALGPSLPHTLVAVGIVWWPWYARIVRAEVRAQAVRSHVDAARLAGVGRARLALRHLLPGAFPAVLVTASLDVGSLVLILAGLSFIGLARHLRRRAWRDGRPRHAIPVRTSVDSAGPGHCRLPACRRRQPGRRRPPRSPRRPLREELCHVACRYW
jgi:peptide/nickel transport system permease protein